MGAKLGQRWLRRVVLVCLFVCSSFAAADTCFSARTGNWNSSTTWGCYFYILGIPFISLKSYPDTGDIAVVQNTHTVTLNMNTGNLAGLQVDAGGILLGDASSRVINLAGNMVINGTLTATGGSSGLLLNSASTWGGSGAVTLDYLDTNWLTLSLSTSATMTISLNDATPLRNVSSLNNGSSPNSLATIILNGAAQPILLDTIKYPNLRLSGGTKTAASGTNLTVLGNLTVDAGATFDIQTNGIANFYLYGNLVNTGSVLAMGSAVWSFVGSSAQTIASAVSIRSVTLNNTAGLTLLGGNLSIGDRASGWGTMILTRGKLTTGSYAVVFPRDCGGSMVTRTAGSWINGNQQLTMPAFNASCIFDVGDSKNYAPITFTYPYHAVPLGGSVTGSTTSGDHPDTTAGTSGISSVKSVNRYWTLTPGTGATFYTFDTTFQYCAATGTSDCTVNDVDTSATASNFKVAEKVTSTWTTYTPTAPTTASRAVTGLTAFGAFAIGEATSGSSCAPPSNIPTGLTLACQCDNFGRASLNPSTMFSGASWIPSTSDSTGVVPTINGTTGFLRLTDNSGNNAKAATAPGFFPAAGNYISIEFQHYAYNGGGADGMGVVLSDYSVPPVPGAFGGSLGYAQKTGINGFAGGWIGVGVDEFGNYSAASEGRIGGTGFLADSIAVRGSGTGTTGYPFLRGVTSSLSPGIDNAGSTTPAYGHFYQIIVDARNSAAGQTFVAVNRDTSGTGSSYTSVIPSFDAFAAAIAAGTTQAAVPNYLQLSFTGSTGGSTNIHEIGRVRVCAVNYVQPDGGSPGFFSAIDDAYSSAVQNFLSGHIYTKLAGTPFKLKVAAISNSQILSTYAISSTKNVTLKLVDNTDGLCGTDANRQTACATSACNGKAAVSGGSQTLAFTSANSGIKTSADFTLNAAYANLVAVMTDGTTTACSIDSFSVRPTLFTSVASSASNSALTGTPKLKAGSDTFTLTATANAGGYTGTPKIATTAMSANAAGWAVGALSPTVFPNATSGASSSAATGTFTYGEVGNFRFLGYNPASDTTSQRGIYDDDWVTVDSVATKNDCIAGSYSNTKNADGKYGCLFGLQDSGASTPNSVLFGRFVPAQFVYQGGGLGQYCSSGSPFSYMGQGALGVAFRIQAQNGAGAVTTNYAASLGYPVTQPTLVVEDQASTYQGCDLASRLSGLPTGQWVSGVYTFNDANADNVPDTRTASFSRPATPSGLTAATCSANRASAGGPFWQLDVGVAMTDTDANATLTVMDMDAGSAGSCSTCTARKIGSTGMLYGRLYLNNAYGAEALPLPVPVQTQYWSSTGWQRNVADSCVPLTVPTRQDTGNAGLVFYAPPDTTRNALAPGEAIAQVNGSVSGSGTVVAGDAKLILRGPSAATVGPGAGNFGYVDLIGSKLTPSTTWLPPSGNARACFGACGPRSSIIYLRESF